MDPVSIVEILKAVDFPTYIFKVVAIIFSIGYLIYGIIFLQQQNKMERNALVYEHLLSQPTPTEQPGKSALYSLALVQLTIALLLLFTSLALL